MRERNTMRLFHMGCGESLSSRQLTTYFRADAERKKGLPEKTGKDKARRKTKK